MLTNPVHSLGSMAEPTAGKPSESMGKDDFLKLLITQLKNQDPLQPMESTEFAAQLAHFSSVEQLTNVNQNLETMITFQESLNNAQAIGFLGKTVRAVGDGITLREGSSAELAYNLSESAKEVSINIYDSNGRLVRNANMGEQLAGPQSFQWDGADVTGNRLPPGEYRFEVSAKGEDGNMITVTTLMEGVVTGVTFQDGIAYLKVGDAFIPAANVVMVVDTTPVVAEPENTGTEDPESSEEAVS